MQKRVSVSVISSIEAELGVKFTAIEKKDPFRAIARLKSEAKKKKIESDEKEAAFGLKIQGDGKLLKSQKKDIMVS